MVFWGVKFVIIDSDFYFNNKGSEGRKVMSKRQENISNFKLVRRFRRILHTLLKALISKTIEQFLKFAPGQHPLRLSHFLLILDRKKFPIINLPMVKWLAVRGHQFSALQFLPGEVYEPWMGFELGDACVTETSC